MIRTALVLFFLLSSVPCSAQEWKEEKGDHFIVFYLSDAAQQKEIIRKAEFYYNKIADALGYARHDNFWSWEKRVKIYIHPDKETFQKATGQPAWSHGMASYFDKEIHSVVGVEGFLDSVLPHEITHLIFRDFVGFRGEIPLWLDEGVAQWQEDEKRREALKVMPKLLRSGHVFLVERLTRTDIRLETDPKRVAAFYLQSISLIDFLIGSYGTSAFTAFCRELRDGKSLEEGLRIAYPGKMAGIEDLEDRWRKHVWSTDNSEENTE